VSPDYPAKTKRQTENRPVAIRAKFGAAATNEVTRRAGRPIEFDACDDELSGAEIEISTV
jgi:hypothetical protein